MDDVAINKEEITEEEIFCPFIFVEIGYDGQFLNFGDPFFIKL